jgi:hypothetical protein
MGNTKEYLKKYRSDNEQKTCVVDGCDKPRFLLTTRCSMHDTRLKIYGSLHKGTIKKGDFEGEYRQARKLITKNLPFHKGIQLGVTFLDGLLMCEDKSYSKHLGCLKGKTSGVQLLAVASAMALFNKRNYFDDDYHFRTQLGHQLLTVEKADKLRVMKGNCKRELADDVLENLSTLLNTIVNSIQELKMKKAEALLYQAIPLMLNN